MFGHFAQADRVCRSSGRFLTNAEREELAWNVERGLLAANALAVEATAAGKKLWKIVPKFHALTHLGCDMHVNPHRVQCYQDEDMVRRAKRVYMRCHGRTAPKRSLMRYSILLGLRLWEEDRVLKGLPKG